MYANENKTRVQTHTHKYNITHHKFKSSLEDWFALHCSGWWPLTCVYVFLSITVFPVHLMWSQRHFEDRLKIVYIQHSIIQTCIVRENKPQSDMSSKCSSALMQMSHLITLFFQYFFFPTKWEAITQTLHSDWYQ